ncbi:serine/threonine protein kinase [Paenibacillus ehimensis]|uniref:serine/threonine protein kinase n=1 Tax=Paenibacillus ehimensis TaxID=79264 RepID=UPI000471B6D9|nr:serine/threonine protein kinase [Paenibacillus ehimensis]MEC0213686.1 serine/threonine protein kinase [Paenibacillus ehimensis]
MTNHSVTVSLDGISFQLKEPHPFDWLRELGRVFCVFDRQDSGNLSFGVQQGGRKKFVKYAGAPTVAFTGTPQEAVTRLKQALPLYEALHHPQLIRLEEHFEANNGYAAVFDWFDGECLHPHWSFPPPQKYTHPDSPFFRFRQLPVIDRLRSLDDIFSFHVHVEASGYVAIDFYDGSILYDFKKGLTKICDIDLYRRKPFINTMGRLWGSSRFMSPEEFELGADIDARTNVFNMGAIAFGLLGGERDRSYSKWEAGKKLYEAALQAVQPDRNERFASVAEFYAAWNSARSFNP